MSAADIQENRDISIRIGGASGYWGDASGATRQLLSDNSLNFIVYDYLAEITMSIMARAKAKDAEMGYAPDFVSIAMGSNLKAIAEQGIKVISNAGGINPIACGKALEQLIAKSGLDLKVACITGDDLIDRANDLHGRNLKGMFNGSDFPDPSLIGSINAYSGAFAIAEALNQGADIVITGRVVDSAVTLGACIHQFGWNRTDYDLLCAGSLAGHIIECGTQATGGNFTDWHLVADEMESMGYPIVEVSGDGTFRVTKPEQSGGLVSIATVGEQILYEIDDPQNYHLPDVTCDFSQVELKQVSDNVVEVSKCRGKAPPPELKTVVTWMDGYRGGMILTFYGFDAAKKAQAFVEQAIKRSNKILSAMGAEPYSATSIEIIGAESQFGRYAEERQYREVNVKIAARHRDQKAVGLLLREITGLALSGPPGLSGFAGTRPRPSPVLALFTCTVPRSEVPLEVHFDGEVTEITQTLDTNITDDIDPQNLPDNASLKQATEKLKQTDTVPVELIKLAWARSGDKGNKANIGIIPRKPEYLPYIWNQISNDVMADRFAHFLEGGIDRYYLPGMNSINFVMDNVLDGGGTASLRNDPQAKGYAQIALAIEIDIPVEMVDGL